MSKTLKQSENKYIAIIIPRENVTLSIILPYNILFSYDEKQFFRSFLKQTIVLHYRILKSLFTKNN